MTWANILFTIEHRYHNKYLNWEMLLFYPQNELILDCRQANSAPGLVPSHAIVIAVVCGFVLSC